MSVTETVGRRPPEHSPVVTDPVIKERVRNGMAFLDERMPGWRERIDIDTLNIESCTSCALAQATGEDYRIAIESHRLSMEQRCRLGFTDLDLGHADLTKAWKQALA
jgi:hypothetical protein